MTHMFSPTNMKRFFKIRNIIIKLYCVMNVLVLATTIGIDCYTNYKPIYKFEKIYNFAVILTMIDWGLLVGNVMIIYCHGCILLRFKNYFADIDFIKIYLNLYMVSNHTPNDYAQIIGKYLGWGHIKSSLKYDLEIKIQEESIDFSNAFINNPTAGSINQEITKLLLTEEMDDIDADIIDHCSCSIWFCCNVFHISFCIYQSLRLVLSLFDVILVLTCIFGGIIVLMFFVMCYVWLEEHCMSHLDFRNQCIVPCRFYCPCCFN